MRFEAGNGMALVYVSQPDRVGPGDRQAVEGRAEDESPRFEGKSAQPSTGSIRVGAEAEQGGPGLIPGELDDVGVPSLGVDRDGDPPDVLGCVPGDRFEAIERHERLPGRVNQHLGRRHADPEAGVRTGAEADGDGRQVGHLQAFGGEQAGDGRDQSPSVAMAGINRGDPVLAPDRGQGEGRPRGRGVEGQEDQPIIRFV